MTTKTEFANQTASRLKAVEHSLDHTLADAFLLTHDMTRHRVDAGFAAQAGHEALVFAQEAQAALVAARSLFIKAHNRLEREARVMGVTVTASGPLEDKPKFPGARAVGLEDARA